MAVYHKAIPDDLPPGDVVVIDPGRSCPLWDLGEPLLDPIVARQDKDSPFLAHVRLDSVSMPGARKLTLKAKAGVLAATAEGDPLYALVERPDGRGRVVVLTVDLDKSDLPLQTAFPILMTNLLGEFRGTRGELREATAAGAVVEVALPPGADPVSLVLRARTAASSRSPSRQGPPKPP